MSNILSILFLLSFVSVSLLGCAPIDAPPDIAARLGQANESGGPPEAKPPTISPNLMNAQSAMNEKLQELNQASSFKPFIMGIKITQGGHLVTITVTAEAWNSQQSKESFLGQLAKTYQDIALQNGLINSNLDAKSTPRIVIIDYTGTEFAHIDGSETKVLR